MKTFLKKRTGKKWTWKSSNRETKNTIQYILTGNPRPSKGCNRTEQTQIMCPYNGEM